MGRKRLYTEEENVERHRRVANRNYHKRARAEQVERFTELIKIVRRNDNTPHEELAHKLADEWRLLKVFDKKYNM